LFFLHLFLHLFLHCAVTTEKRCKSISKSQSVFSSRRENRIFLPGKSGFRGVKKQKRRGLSSERHRLLLEKWPVSGLGTLVFCNDKCCPLLASAGFSAGSSARKTGCGAA
jgi:hypothetical protein